MRKKQVAVIIGPLVIGGAEKSLVNLLHDIDYSKYEVDLWLKDNTGALEPQVDPRVTIRYWGEVLQQNYTLYVKTLLQRGRVFRTLYSLICRFLSRVFVKGWHKNFKYYIKSMPRLGDKKYDIAISYHSLVKEDLMVLDYAVMADQKIGWIHGACRHDHCDPYFASFPIEYGRLDHIFCVSKSVQKIFLEKYPNLTQKTSVMYNLQSFEEIRRLAKEPVAESFDGLTFVTVGRLSPEKGQDMIPEIARRLYDDGVRFTWYVIGEGITRATIESNNQKWGTEKQVILLGNRINPYPYIERCSLYIQPSYSEGFCVTTFEAMILDKPQVVTDVPGMREQFPNGEAIICRPIVDDLVGAIEEGIKRLSEQRTSPYRISSTFNEDELEKLYHIIGEESCRK